MGEKLKELDGDFWPEGIWSIRVADETGAIVCHDPSHRRLGHTAARLIVSISLGPEACDQFECGERA